MRTFFLMFTLLLHTQAFAIQLDCTDNRDGTYTCVEIKSIPAAESAAAGAAVTTTEDTTDYRKEAEARCTYLPPRNRMSGKKVSSALALEEQKTAQKKYEKCLSEEAQKLRDAAIGSGRYQ